MPAWYDIPLAGNDIVDRMAIEDVNKFQKLPFYLVMNEVKRFPIYKTFDALYGSIKWQANMGSTMRGVRPEFSPIGDQFVNPANITGQPNKNVYETLESIEEATLKAHRFESKQFHFLPSFQDFRDNQIKWNHDDLIRQISLFNEKFIRGQLWNRAPNVMIVGNKGGDAGTFGTDELYNMAPASETLSSTQQASGNYKTKEWIQALTEQIGANLTLKAVYRACNILDDDLNAPPFEGVMNQPRDNELIKGKYVLVTSTEAWRAFTFDPDVANLKSIELDLLFDNFKGSLFGMVTCKPERFPLRIGLDGTFTAPQVTDDRKKTRPNPAYASIITSPYEIAFLMGADCCKTIAVGPPPSEFTKRAMDASKFYSLRWNGEIQLTDQVLIRLSDGTPDLNKYGTNLQLISQLALGLLPGEINNVLPIVFRRKHITGQV